MTFSQQQGMQRPPAPPGGVLVNTPDIAGMQAQLADLQVQLAGMRKEWDGLFRQLDRMSQSNPARAGVQQKHADMGVKIAQTEGQIAALKVRLGMEQAPDVYTGVPQTPPMGRQGPDPDMVVGLSFLLAIGVFVPLAIARARRIWRGTPKPLPPQVSDGSSARFDRIEQAVDAIAIEIERVSESQRFMTKLMAERGEPARPAAGSESKQALGPDGRPLLALGAGPIEPIRIPERQPVRQSITPH